MSFFDKFEYISSKDNERVKLFSKLSDAKYRNESKLFLAEGIKLTDEAVSAGVARYILVRENEAENGDFISVVSNSDAQIILLSNAAFAKITTEKSPQGIIAVADFPDFHRESCEVSPCELSHKRCIALDSVRDPGNIGTIIRSAVAFGFDTVILGSCADIYNTKTVRASMGALFRINAVVCDDLSSYISELGKERRIIGAALGENNLVLGKYEKKDDDVIVIGNEGSGITDEVLAVCSDLVKIPMGELSESLNAAIAASVLMWEYRSV